MLGAVVRLVGGADPDRAVAGLPLDLEAAPSPPLQPAFHIGSALGLLLPVQPGDHLCLIYRSAAERSATLVPFVEQALAAEARFLSIADAESTRALEQALAAAGVAVGAERERGSLLLLETRDLVAGAFEPHAMIDVLRQAEQQALDDGWSGLRIAWQAEGADAGRLVEYEALLNRFLAASRSIGTG